MKYKNFGYLSMDDRLKGNNKSDHPLTEGHRDYTILLLGLAASYCNCCSVIFLLFRA